MTLVQTVNIPKDVIGSAALRIHRHWKRRPHTFWLDSASDNERLGRFSFLGTDPHAVFTASGASILCATDAGTQRWSGDAFAALRRVAQSTLTRQAPVDFPAPFAGGLVGYIGYDVGRRQAGLPVGAARHRTLPDMMFGLYDAIVCVDHLEGRLYIVSTGLPFSGSEGTAKARARLDWLKKEVKQALHTQVPAGEGAIALTPPSPVSAPSRGTDDGPFGAMRSNFTRSEYVRLVQRVLGRIEAGDIEQVNVAQRFEVPTDAFGPDLYYVLRKTNPAPYAALLQVDDAWILSSSPERFLHIRGDHIELRPIKGTRPRGRDAAEDARLRAALLASKKDEAEHTMIVERVQAELERLCTPGSVHVPEPMVCETYETVFHLVSTVAGRLPSGADTIDVVRELFPGDSITGRPKRRSMELIDKLEPVGRGVYTGAIGYIGIGGNIDLNIAIRTVVLEDDRAHFHVGGAVVADSVPEEEYDETLDKAEGIVRALQAARSPFAAKQQEV